MVEKGITLLGLGPGDPKLLTREAWQVLSDSSEVWLRTRHHPVVKSFPPNLKVYSFDNLYDACEAFEEVYQKIVERVMELGRRSGGVVYCVPGHPLVAEATGPEIIRIAQQQKINVNVIEGISFLEPTLTALNIDFLPHTAIVDALEIASAHVPPFPPNVPAIIAQIYSRQVASNVKLTLTELYPDDHRVQLVHAAGTSRVQIETLALFEIDRSTQIGLLTSLYVPPLGIEKAFEAFQEVIAHLRSPEGCPWDREQTHQTLRSDLLEEAYELVSAIDEDAPDSICEELGDLLLLIVMHAQIASEYGEFTMSDVLSGIHRKIVHRHPHVFGGQDVSDPQDVLLNWERMKANERAANDKAESSMLDGVSRALPALIQANQYQQRVARVGFDWHQIEGVWEKLLEELEEVQEAESETARYDEVGDLLFAVVNLARWHEIDPESALRQANARFRNRFLEIEKAARAQGRDINDLTLDEMETIWQAAKVPDQD